jgi:hypothetical protein
LLEKTHGRAAPWVDSEQFIAAASKRIETGELTISRARVPVGPDGTEILVVRYQRRGCEKKVSMNWGRVEFFKAESEELTKLERIEGMGSPTDIFLFRGRAYFESASYRDFDDTFRHRLKRAQPLLYIHRMFERNHMRVCRLLYWDTPNHAVETDALKRAVHRER